jgi:hypothetical protein
VSPAEPVEKFDQDWINSRKKSSDLANQAADLDTIYGKLAESFNLMLLYAQMMVYEDSSALLDEAGPADEYINQTCR